MKHLYTSLLLTLLASLGLLLFSSCGSKNTEPVSPYQKENDAFVARIASSGEYTPLRFLNEDYDIYYKEISAPLPENKERRPLQNSKVKVYLTGWLYDGAIFQPRTDAPMDLTLYATGSSGAGSVIKGLRIALQNMSVGSRWEVVIPWQLAYGYRQYNSYIPGYSTLVFDVELVDIVE